MDFCQGVWIRARTNVDRDGRRHTSIGLRSGGITHATGNHERSALVMQMSVGTVDEGGIAEHGYLSYAHDDHADVQRLMFHLRATERSLGLDFWTDASITAGGRWKAVIDDQIAQSTVFLLCMSPAYLSSSYLYDVEFPAIEARVRSSDALMVPVILRPCPWCGFVGDYQAVPVRNGRVVPISQWRPRDDGYDTVISQIVEGIRHFRATKEKDGIQRILFPRRDPVPIMPPAPGHHKIPPRDIERAVRTVIARQPAKTVS